MVGVLKEKVVLVLIVLSFLCMLVFAQTAVDWDNNGKALEAQGKWNEAIQAYDKAIDINPQDEIAWTNKANALKVIGRTTEANAAYAKIKELEAARTASIIDHSMASNVNESAHDVITRTYNFSSNDSKAYSWLSLRNVGADTVWWEWWSPAGNLLYNDRVDIPAPIGGAYWSTYNVSSHIDIIGKDAANLSGGWHVDVLLKGQKILTEYFSIGQPSITPEDQSGTPAFGRATADYWFNRGADLYAQGKYDEAIQAYDKAIDIDPKFASAWTKKGDALRSQGKLNEATQAYDKAFEISTPTFVQNLTSPGNTTISSNAPGTAILDHSMANNVDESTNNVITRTNTFSSTDRKAYSWLTLGNVGDCTIEWKWYSPDGMLYKMGSVDIYPNQNDGYWPSYKIWYYIDIAGDMPSDLPGIWNVDVYRNGFKFLTEKFYINGGRPGTAAYWSNQGAALYLLGKYDEAIQACNKAIDIDPQYASAWSNKGAALEYQGKYDEAIQACNKAIDIDSQNEPAWYNKGLALHRQSKYDEAIQAFNKATDINQQDEKAWYYKGNALYLLGKYDESIQAFNRATDIDPQDADAWYDKGDALEKLGRTKESEEAFEMADDLW